MYSFSLLLNFLMASMQICFIAFQVTESTVEVILIYCIFLMTSMVQVFLVCYYGDALIEAVSGANSLPVPFFKRGFFSYPHRACAWAMLPTIRTGSSAAEPIA